MSWKPDRNKTECPRCKDGENTMHKFNRRLARPRSEYRCDMCQLEWHYSAKGHAVDSVGNYV